ncbi:MAG: hypothetical protein EX285_04645 [Thaumarchaeota archaeon]|nr:hypothetical protein [Nitrososphaerota archaeon]
MSTTPDKQRITELLQSLADFLNIPSARKLTKDLESEIAKIELKETKAVESIEVKAASVIKSNLSRSTKLKKHHRFINLIQSLAREQNIDLPYVEVRRQLKSRKARMFLYQMRYGKILLHDNYTSIFAGIFLQGYY